MVRQRVRVRFQKTGELRAVSHLDLMRAFERALRRTGLPLRMSEGYNPRPRLSFPAPLGVGMEGLDEAMEFELGEWTPPPEIESRLRAQLPEGLTLLRLEVAPGRRAAQATEATYRATPIEPLREDPRLAAEALDALMKRVEIPVGRRRKKRDKTVNIRPFLLALRRDGDELILRVTAGSPGSARPEEVLGALGFDDETIRGGFRLTRVEVRLADPVPTS